MERTGVDCAFKLINDADAVTAFELVPEGGRVRLYSAIWFPYMNQSSSSVVNNMSIQFTNGQSGDVLFRVGFGAGAVGLNPALFTPPLSYLPVPRNGILFDNGIWAQGTEDNASNGGVLAVSITYQGAGSSVL